MQTRLVDSWGNTWVYEQEQGISLFRHRDTGELKQDIAGAYVPGRGWEMVNNVPALIPIPLPEKPAEPDAPTLSQRLAKELAAFTFPTGFKQILFELAVRVEGLEGK